MPELPMDPDLEQVLVDLEADPRAGLYLAEPRKLIRGLRDGSLMVRPSRTGLSSAQRELLGVHRHELAWLLREAWLREFFDSPDSIQAARRISLSSREDLRKRWSYEWGAMPDEIRREPQTRLLRSFLKPAAETFLPARTSLVWASLMVESPPHARVYLGMEHLFSGQPRAALMVLREVAEGPSSGLLRAQAESYSGVALLSLERPEKALLRYRRAYELVKGDPRRGRALEHLFNVLGIALVLREEELVTWAGERIRTLPVPSGTFVSEAATRIRARGTPREFVLEAEARAFAARIAEELDSTSREFVHELL